MNQTAIRFVLELPKPKTTKCGLGSVNQVVEI
jgi:hypothetical protein